MAKDPIPSLAWPAGPRPSLIPALLEIAIVFVVLAAPLSAAGYRAHYPLVPLGVGSVYVIWALVAALRRTAPRQPLKSRAAPFMLAQFAGGTTMVGAVAILGFAAWFPVTYRWEVVAPGGTEPEFPLAFAAMAPEALGAAIGAAALFLASAALLRRDDEGVSACFRRIRDEGVGILRTAAAAWLLPGLALVSLLSVAATGTGLPEMLRSTNPAQIVDIEYLATAYPGFAAAILAAATLTVAFRRVQPAALASLRQPPRAARIPAVLAVLGSAAAAYGWYLYFVHIWVIGTFGAISMIAGWGEISRATDRWIDAQQAAGRTPAEIASELRDHGRWTTQEPGAGLPALLPELGKNLAHLGLGQGCTVTVDTGIADNSALRDLSWIDGYVAAFRPLPEISYCIRLACPSPVAAHSHPVVILSSSHPSRNRGWAYNVFMDMSASGAAYESGGHCTVDGALSVRYRG
jgi:hypothetical protein